MTKYKNLLFDIDDTLLDFQKGEVNALAKMFAYVGLPDTKEVRTKYHRYNKAMWDSLEKGYISREYLFAKRFTSFLSKIYGIEGFDPHDLNAHYQEWLAQGFEEIPGAKAMLAQLKEAGYNLVVVTNGAGLTQKIRLKKSGLDKHFSKVFISEEIGYQKPDKRFFDYVFKEGGLDPKESLVIGDSLTSDIQGANNAGLDSVWFNPSWKRNTTGIYPTYAVKDWSSFIKYLGEEENEH